MMTNEYKSKGIITGRIIPPIKAKGHLQMAIDLLLLEESIIRRIPYPTIRFYYWDGFCISVGKNQTEIPKRWHEIALKKKINIVRRPTGGSAVLHGGGITYSIVWPNAPIGRKRAYLESCQWIIKAFAELGQDLYFGKEVATLQKQNCFATSSNADLVDIHGNKRIGSAQLWRGGNLLQHGEILIDPNPHLWIEFFNENPPKKAPDFIPREGLDRLLCDFLQYTWPNLSWSSKKIDEKEITSAKKESNKYLIVDH